VPYISLSNIYICDIFVIKHKYDDCIHLFEFNIVDNIYIIHSFNLYNNITVIDNFFLIKNHLILLISLLLKLNFRFNKLIVESDTDWIGCTFLKFCLKTILFKDTV
jgi:hypothetical protein